MLSSSLLELLACPIDKSSLSLAKGSSSCLVCQHDHRFPVIDGVPVLLPPGVQPTLPDIDNAKHSSESDGPLYLSTVLLSEAEKEGILKLASTNPLIDPVAAYLVAATNGIAYIPLIGKLSEYPIPELRLPKSAGKLLLDVGCSWGRWTVAAGKLGYQTIGIDPSLGAVMAARRVLKSFGMNGEFVVGDARYLPFKADVFDQVFSYSVIQHLSYEDAGKCFTEIGRALKAEGCLLVQMPTKWGVRCLYNQIRRGFRNPINFEVRYWSHSQLKTTIEQAVGASQIEADCYFGIGWQGTDKALLPMDRRLVLYASIAFTSLSRWIVPLRVVADSVYIRAIKQHQRARPQ